MLKYDMENMISDDFLINDVPQDEVKYFLESISIKNCYLFLGNPSYKFVSSAQNEDI